MQSKPTVIDFFAGAGGLSLGFARAGFQVEMAVDNCAVALETHRWNLGDHAQGLDLGGADLVFPSATVVAGGPPCQGFSSAGQRRRGDDRNTLVGEFARLVAQIRPAVFVFENVEGFLTAEGGSRVIELLEPLNRDGLPDSSSEDQRCEFRRPAASQTRDRDRSPWMGSAVSGADARGVWCAGCPFGRNASAADSDSRRGACRSAVGLERCAWGTRGSLLRSVGGFGS